MINVLNKEHIDKEKAEIYKAAEINGYHINALRSIVDHLIKKKIKKFATTLDNRRRAEEKNCQI